MIDHIVPDGVGAMPLPRYLARAWPMLPGWALREALKKRDVRLNDRRADGQAAVRGGDRLRLYFLDKYLGGPLAVLHEDGRLLAVVKPAGLPVDVDEMGVGADTVLARARGMYPGARLCHRLDAGTGGAMLLALNDRAEEEMRDAFERHLVGKTYHAMVKGAPPPEGTLTNYLLRDAAASRVSVLNRPVPGAVEARLRFAVIGRGEDRSLVRVELFTGRTHQIRAQMAHIGHPLLGDDKYGDRAFNKRAGVSQPMLWCVCLTYGGKRFVSPAPFGPEGQM